MPVYEYRCDQGHTFEQIQNAFYRLVDNSTDAELARYSPQAGMAFTAIAMAEAVLELRLQMPAEAVTER